MGKNKFKLDGLEVMRAIYYDDEAKLCQALENNINIDARNEFGETALMYACSSGEEEVVRKILACKADVNLQNKLGNTPIIYACDRGNKNIVKYLVEKGANVNHRTHYGRTALFCACNRADIDIVRYLIEHGADVNCETREGYTPLIRACEICNLELVKCLVNSGANVDAKNIAFETALMYAAKNGVARENIEIVLYLVDHGIDLDEINNSIELRDFMKRIIAKEPKVGALIAMRKGGLKEVKKFLDKFLENIRNECMIFLARSNTAKKIKEDNETLEKQLKKEVLLSLKLINPSEEVEKLVKKHVQQKPSDISHTDVGEIKVVSNKDSCIAAQVDVSKKNEAHIVDDFGVGTRQNKHVRRHKTNGRKHDKKKTNTNKNKDVDTNKNGDTGDNRKLSLVDILNHNKFDKARSNISIVSRIQCWEKNGIERRGVK